MAAQGVTAAEQLPEKKLRPFGMRDKVGYMFGDFGNDFTFILQMMFFMVFYTNVVGINPSHVGTLFLVSRILDAFTDVGMGTLVDRLPAGKDGKFRRWIKWGAIPVATVSALMYATWTVDWSYTAKVAWMAITYFLWGSITYTLVNIPYGSMASVMSSNPDERATLSVFRSTGAQLAVLAIQVIMPLIVYVEVDGNSVLSGERTFIAALICSVLAVVCYMICYANVLERVNPDEAKEEAEDKGEKMSFGKTLGTIFSNRALVGIVVAAWALLIGNLLISTMQAYLWLDYFNAGRMQSVAGFAGMVPPLALLVLAPAMARRWGKREVGVVAMLASGILALAMYFLKLESTFIFIVFYAALQFGIATFNFLIWAFITDVIDYQEVRTGERNDATVYAVYSWARKVGQAVAGGLGGWALGWIGYQQASGTEQIVQTPEVQQGIYMLTTLVPGILFILVALALQFIYPLSKAKVTENAQILAERRAAASVSE